MSIAAGSAPALADNGESIARKVAKGKVKAAVLQMQVIKDGQVVTLTRPLPFLSAGGSSLVITMLAAGILANVARRTPSRTPARRKT